MADFHGGQHLSAVGARRPRVVLHRVGGPHDGGAGQNRRPAFQPAEAIALFETRIVGGGDDVGQGPQFDVSGNGYDQNNKSRLKPVPTNENDSNDPNGSNDPNVQPSR